MRPEELPGGSRPHHEEQVCDQCGGSALDGARLCEECRRQNEAEELLEEIERAAVVGILFDAFG